MIFLPESLRYFFSGTTDCVICFWPKWLSDFFLPEWLHDFFWRKKLHIHFSTVLDLRVMI